MFRAVLASGSALAAALGVALPCEVENELRVREATASTQQHATSFATSDVRQANPCPIARSHVMLTPVASPDRA